MPDWLMMVRQRLCGLELDPAEREEVHAELAAHLEEAYDALRREGLPEHEAIRGALSQVRNWNRLQRRICAAKERPMKKRAQQLWIPGFLTLILSMVSLAVLYNLGVHPGIVSIGPSTILFYGPWLLSLPLFGALGAYFSSRAGSSGATILLASVFPVLALTLAFLLMFPIGWTVQWVLGRPIDFNTVAPGLLRDGMGWLVLPGIALFVGGLLVQLFLSRGPSSKASVIRS